MCNDARTVTWGKRNGYHTRNCVFLTGIRMELLERDHAVAFAEIDGADALRGNETLRIPLDKIPEIIKALAWLAGGPLTRMVLEAEE